MNTYKYRFLLLVVYTIFTVTALSQSGTYVIECMNTLGVNIRSTKSISGGNVIAALAYEGKLVTFDLDCEPNNPSNAFEWYRVYIPSSNGIVTSGYMVKASYLMDASCNSAHIKVINAPSGLRIRTGPGTTYSIAKIGPNDAKIWNDTRFAVAAIQYVGGVPWYQIYVPNNVTNSSGSPILKGWVSGSYATYHPGSTAGSIQVNITPPAVVAAGAKWRLDDDCWQDGGTQLTNICPGSYTIFPAIIPGYIPPAAPIITLSSGQDFVYNFNYIPIANSVTVTILPSAAISAGAQWRLDGGPWRNSGYTETNVSSGSHTISFSSISGWTKPSNQNFNVSSGQNYVTTGTYSEQTGSVEAFINPQAANNDGAQWRLDGGPWRNSGYLESNVSVGIHTVSYKSLNGWNSPSSQTISVNTNQTSETTGTYFPDPTAVSIPEAQAIKEGYYSGHGLDPVNLATGAFVLGYKDFSLPAIGTRLEWKRYYNSRNSNYSQGLGSGWTHSYDIFITITSGEWIVHYGDGHEEVFIHYPNGTSFPRHRGVYQSLVKNADNTYTLTLQEGTEYNFSHLGRLETIIDRNGNITALSYSGNNLTSVSAPGGRSLLINHDANDRISNITDPLGRTVTYSYDINGNLDTFTSPINGNTSYSYDAQGQILSITDPNGNVVLSNTYDGSKRVISQVDALGQTTSINYDTPIPGATTVVNPTLQSRIYYHDSNFRLIQETNEQGSNTQYAYDDNNNLLSLFSPLGAQTNYAYSGEGFITSITDPLGQTTNITYNMANSPLYVINPKGDSIIMNYDSNENLLGRLLPNGGSVGLAYSGIGQVQSLTNPGGSVSTFLYNSFGDIISQTNSLGTTTFSYDAGGRITSITDPLNHTSSFAYDAYDNLISETNHLGNTTTFQYDLNGNLTSITDKKGAITSFQYDSKDQLIQITDPIGAQESYTYDFRGNVLSFTDKNGNTLSNTYDVLGQLASTTNALGTRSFNFDVDGNLISETDALGNSYSYTYNLNGQLLSESDPIGSSRSYTYDQLGLLVNSTNALGQITQYSFDKIGRLTNVINPLGDSAQYSYNLNSNLVGIIDPEGNTQQFNYDQEGRLISKTDALGNNFTYVYDAVSNLLSSSEPNGVVTNYTYDALNRINLITYSTGENYSFSYDTNSNLISTQAAIGTTTFTYDSRNLLNQVTDPFGNVTQYSYDDIGNQSKITYPGGDTVVYTFNGFNQINSVQDWLGNIYNYSYNANGRLTEIQFPNLNKTQYSYDDASRLTSIKHIDPLNNLFYHVGLVLDGVGNRTQEQVFVTPSIPKITIAQSYTYQHDADDRMISDGVDSYTYDNSGNGITRTGPVSSSTYTFSGPNLLTNLVNNGQTTSFEYDGLGNRVRRVKNGNAVRYALDLNQTLSQVLQEKTDNGATLTSYIYGDHLLASIDSLGSPLYYHFDVGGNTIGITNGNGQLIKSYTYDPFGQVLSTSGNLNQPYTFLGQYGIQKETDRLYFIRARYYDAVGGRFISKDPYPLNLENPQTLHRYIYALNNPLSFIDINGFKEQGLYDQYYYGGPDAAWVQGTPLWLRGVQIGLDACGLFPVYGEICDLANAGIYAIRGDRLNASLSAGSAIPFVGWAGTTAKWGVRGTQYINYSRKYLLEVVENKKLRNIVNDLYKYVGPDPIGDGSAMDAVRKELITGQPVGGRFHSKKIEEYGRALQKLKRKKWNTLSQSDKEIINNLLENIDEALSRTPK